MQQAASARRMLPAGLTVLGGLLLVVGSLLPWVTFQVAYRGFAFSRSSSGLDTWAGRIVLGIGILAIAGGAAITMLRSSSAARGVAVVRPWLLPSGSWTAHPCGRLHVPKSQLTKGNGRI